VAVSHSVHLALSTWARAGLVSESGEIKAGEIVGGEEVREEVGEGVGKVEENIVIQAGAAIGEFTFSSSSRTSSSSRSSSRGRSSSSNSSSGRSISISADSATFLVSLMPELENDGSSSSKKTKKSEIRKLSTVPSPVVQHVQLSLEDFTALARMGLNPRIGDAREAKEEEEEEEDDEERIEVGSKVGSDEEEREIDEGMKVEDEVVNIGLLRPLLAVLSPAGQAELQNWAELSARQLEPEVFLLVSLRLQTAVSSSSTSSSQASGGGGEKRRLSKNERKALKGQGQGQGQGQNKNQPLTLIKEESPVLPTGQQGLGPVLVLVLSRVEVADGEGEGDGDGCRTRVDLHSATDTCSSYAGACEDAARVLSNGQRFRPNPADQYMRRLTNSSNVRVV
jgi:hypothetical protein